MKKTLLFLFLSLVMMGCKQGNEAPSTKAIAASAVSCGENIIVIDARKTDAAWKAKNEKFFCDLVLTNRKENHTHDYFVVDLNRVSISPNVIGSWLQENTKVICYEESYESIQKKHQIDPSAVQPAPNSLNGRLKFSEIKAKIQNFDTLFYDTYVKFSLQSGKVELTPHNQFDYTKNMYSIPLLKAIAYNDKTIDDNTIFEFYDIEDNDPNNQFIAFGIVKEIGRMQYIYAFYDITTNPKMMEMLYSPKK